MVHQIYTTFVKTCLIYALVLQTIFVPGLSLAQDDTSVTDLGTAPSAASSNQSECSKNDATEWDSSLNRCVNKRAAVQDRKEYLECAKIKDDARRKQCHDDYAKKRANFDEDFKLAFKGAPLLAASLNMVLAVVTFINTTGKDQEPKGCTAKTIIKYTAVANVLFELYYRFMAKKALEDLQKNYEEKVASEDAHQAQVEAFEFIKEEQKEIEKLADLRFKQYAISTAGYAAAGVMAAIALSDITGTQYAACTGADKGAQEERSNMDKEGSTATTEQKTAADTKIENSTATGDNPAAKEATAAFFNSLPTLITLCAIMGVYNGYLASEAMKEKNKAETRAKAMDAIIAKFKNSVAGYCPSGRDDIAEPRCYCYTESGAQNDDRSNSETCQALWAADNQNNFVAATDYSQQKTKNPKGCMTKNRQFDQKCKCRKFKDQNGENACYKVPKVANVNIPGFATSANQLGKTINDLTNGATSPADLSNSTLTKNAARLTRFRDKALKELNKIRRGQGFKPLGKVSQKQALKFAKKLTNKKSIARAAKGNFTNLGSNSNKPALQKAMKEAAKLSGLSFGGGKGLAQQRMKKQKGFNLDFGNNRGSGGGGGQVQAFMDKSYNYKENDIVKRDDVSIFQVITNRYNVSGLKRLFEDEEGAAE